MTVKERKPSDYLAAIAVLLGLFGLFLTSLYSYLLFHTLVELFSIVIAFSIFVIAWNTRHLLRNSYLLFLAIAFLFIGTIDLVHTLAYKGMGVFQGYDANLPTQLWIAGRYTQSLSLLIAPFLIGRRLKTILVVLVYAVVVSLLLASVFYWKMFPDCYVEGFGLTPFKKVSEYIISLFLLASIVLLTLKRREFDKNIFRLLVGSIVISIASELAFTFYISVYDFSNFVGHLFKVLAFYLIYGAIVQTGLEKPFSLLFRELKQGEEALREFSATLERTVAERTANLARANAELVQEITARKQADADAERRLHHLEAARAIDIAITGSLDRRVVLNVLLDQVVTQLKVDAADVLLLNPHSQTLEYAAGRGFRTGALQHTKLTLGTGHAGRAAYERRLVSVPNLAEEQGELYRSPMLAAEEFVAYFGVPLIGKEQVKGVLEVFHRASVESDPEWLAFLEALAGQAAIAIDQIEMFQNLQRANTELLVTYDATLAGWARALDARDRETEGHTRRVTEMTVRLARELVIGEGELVNARRGALMHDIGKMAIPDGILLKPGPLTDEEWEVMRKHPEYAYEMLYPIPYLRHALDIPHCHHEKWDGTGYPRGLKGDRIPQAACIFAVVDVWDALTSDRPYRTAWPEEKALEYLREQSGKHFDPAVAQAFLRLIEKGNGSP